MAEYIWHATNDMEKEILGDLLTAVTTYNNGNCLYGKGVIDVQEDHTDNCDEW